MRELMFGERLVEEKRITEKQLHKSLERQRLHGGRLGNNMVDLGFINEEDLTDFFMNDPDIPQSVEETGLDFSFILDLVLKHGLNLGEFTIPEMAERVKLSSPVVDQAIRKRVGTIWMQLGIIHNEAAQKAREAGITVVMDRCMKQEHEKMGA